MGILAEISFLVEVVADTHGADVSENFGLKSCIDVILEVRRVDLVFVGSNTMTVCQHHPALYLLDSYAPSFISSYANFGTFCTLFNRPWGALTTLQHCPPCMMRVASPCLLLPSPSTLSMS